MERLSVFCLQTSSSESFALARLVELERRPKVSYHQAHRRKPLTFGTLMSSLALDSFVKNLAVRSSERRSFIGNKHL